jgi:hypothetical protein
MKKNFLPLYYYLVFFFFTGATQPIVGSYFTAL